MIKKIMCGKCGGTGNGKYDYLGDVDVIDWVNKDYVVTLGNISKGGRVLFGKPADELVAQNDEAALEHVAKFFTFQPYKVTIGIRFDIYKQAVTRRDGVGLGEAHWRARGRVARAQGRPRRRF